MKNNSQLNTFENKKGLVIRSSGTSLGKCKQITHSWDFNKKVMEAGSICLQNLEPFPQKIANLLTAGSLNGAFLFVHGISELINAQAFPIGVDTDFATLKQIFKENEIDTICCTPAYLEYLFNNKVFEENKSLIHILFIGQMITEKLKNDITKKHPQIKIQSIAYSTTETGPIGYQCTHLPISDFHILEDYVDVCLMNTNNTDKNEGVILVTPKFSNSEELINYNTNDLGQFIDEKCACGTTNKTLRLFGRFNESAKIYLNHSKYCVDLIADEIISSIQKVILSIEKNEIQVCIIKENEVQISLDLYLFSKYSNYEKKDILTNLKKIAIINLLLEKNYLLNLNITYVEPYNFKMNTFKKTPFFLKEENNVTV